MGGDNLIMTNHERIYSYNLRDFLTTQTNHKPKILWKARVPRILTPQFRGIRGMAIQYSTTDYGEKIQNVLYASDFSRSKVYVFSCVDGRLLKEITHPVIHSPWGMDFNSRGELLLSDFRANKIYMLKCTLDQVQLLKSFGDNELQIPRQVIVDRVTQNIIVYSQENRIICVYDRNGNYLTSSDARVQLSLLQDIMLFNHFTGELLIMDRLFLNTDVLV
nr:unnamed protein product [Naegleria fowleri]